MEPHFEQFIQEKKISRKRIARNLRVVQAKSVGFPVPPTRAFNSITMHVRPAVLGL
jgi:hypothetical protein